MKNTVLTQRISIVENKVTHLFLAVVLLIMVFSALIFIIGHKEHEKEQHLDIVAVNGVFEAPYNTLRYICTDTVTVQDYRGQCGAATCSM